MGHDELTYIYSSAGGGWYDIYEDYGPMDGFPQLPVDYCRRRGSYYGSKTELRALFAGVDDNLVYIDMEIYQNCDGPSYLLDCFVRRPDNTGWSLWNLEMPAAPP